jgi:hypothetical protein
MSLEIPRAEVLREALAYRHAGSFERALGRAVRKHGGVYADYLALITEVRECGRRGDLDLRAAARELASQS